MSTDTSKFTREDKKKLDRKRAINPALSAGAAGASGAALLANVGGMALRNSGQKKQFNDKLNDYEWVKREGASAKRMKAAKIGSKLQAKAIPITLAAGGINAAAAANGIQMSNLWNKKDKIKTVGVSKSRNDYRTLKEVDRRAAVQRRKQKNSLTAAGTGVGLLGAAYHQRDAINRELPGVKTMLRAKRFNPIKAPMTTVGAVGAGLAAGGAMKFGYHKGRETGIQNYAQARRRSNVHNRNVQKSFAALATGYAARKAKNKGAQMALQQLQNKGVIPNLSALAPTQRDKFFQGLGAGTLITAIAATPMLSSAFNRSGMDEFRPGVKK